MSSRKVTMRREKTGTGPDGVRCSGSACAQTPAGTGIKRPRIAIGWAPLMAAWIAACATPLSAADSGEAAAAVPVQWHAPLPHGGQLADLSRWWSRFDDPQMSRMIEAAQRVSATVAEAGARIADARAARTASMAALLPSLDADGNAVRGVQRAGVAVGTTGSLGFQALWEIDLFGGQRAGAHAAQARLEASEAGWHDARVAVAAEVAKAYVGLRACEAQLAQAELDVRSRSETSRLTDLVANAGFRAPVEADRARASAAQARAALTQQRVQCDQAIKSLVALTASDEAVLRHELAGNTARLPVPAALHVAAVPAMALTQRPDIAVAARAVVAASADAEQARALRWPRITLSGSIGTSRESAAGIHASGSVWNMGPVSVTLPLFDGGVRRANADAARAHYDAARATYAASLRAAVRETEGALVTLHSAAERSEDARIAVAGFERSYHVTDARYRGGLASLFELEDARRSMVASRSALIAQQHEAVMAWIDLYRAIGGGWESATTTDAPPPQ